MSDAAAIAGLERTRDAVLPFFSSDAATLARPYAPGKWSMRQVLMHLVDQEQLYLDRLRRVAADDQPLMWDTIADHWTQRLFSDRRSLQTAAALYRATRDSAIELARLAPQEIWAREGVHVGIGKLSFARLLAMMHGHTERHLEHLRAIAAGRTWTP
jgi:hypothetical protein